MPVEIRELVIRTNIDERKGDDPGKTDIATLRKSIVAECLSRMNEQLKMNQSR